MFSNFDYSKFLSGNATEQTAIIPAAMNYIVSQEDGKNRFVKAVMDLSKAFALSVPHGKALEIRDDVGFFQVIRAQISTHKLLGDLQKKWIPPLDKLSLKQ
jgi:type I restriction enzyme R subunit